MILNVNGIEPAKMAPCLVLKASLQPYGSGSKSGTTITGWSINGYYMLIAHPKLIMATPSNNTNYTHLNTPLYMSTPNFNSKNRVKLIIIGY